jgi:AcrR family transcriptional regulator
MGIASRKERERRQREEAILEAARVLLLERGYHGLTMDRIAEAVEYSKATIYLHFHCKEEVIATLATRFMETQLEMQERAATFPGSARERLTAVGEAVELFSRLYPGDVHILHNIQTEAFSEKTSEDVTLAMQELEQRGMNVMTGITRDAVAMGDLELPDWLTPEDLSMGLWSTVIGGQLAALRNLSAAGGSGSDALSTVMHLCQAMGDGLNWRPLSTEMDYDAVRERVRETLFPEEAAAAYAT